MVRSGPLVDKFGREIERAPTEKDIKTTAALEQLKRESDERKATGQVANYDVYMKLSQEKMEAALKAAKLKEERLEALARGEDPDAKPAAKGPWTRLKRAVLAVLARATGEEAERKRRRRLMARQHTDRLDDPEFVQAVGDLMQSQKIMETFAMFDTDGSGSVSADELKNVIQMVDQAPTKGDVANMVKELDINGDGDIDLWEFCVYMQKKREQSTAEDAKAVIDRAFAELLPGDENGMITVHELRKVFTWAPGGDAVTEEEFADMLLELSPSTDADGKMKVADFRAHPCWQDES